ncbi:MAG TPA: MOSC domain-containing protein [Acidimicrobiales bacterium]|nr:MOSC domain-containing protein [Acidimicrobiales bacterium]
MDSPRTDAGPATDGLVWDDQDLAGTARTVHPWWSLLTQGVDPLPRGLPELHEAALAHRAVIRSDASFAARAAAGTALVAAMSAAARAVHEAGWGPAARAGTVTGVFAAAAGGVPKPAVPEAEVGWRGLVGDAQADRRHHGRVWQALCLWSAEVVAGIAAEGHPIFPGAAGENVSITGLDWGSLRPGTRLRLGTALAEVSVPALPCGVNGKWFLGGNHNRMHHERFPGESRLYALVVVPGRVAVGDAALVEPA